MAMVPKVDPCRAEEAESGKSTEGNFMLEMHDRPSVAAGKSCSHRKRSETTDEGRHSRRQMGLKVTSSAGLVEAQSVCPGSEARSRLCMFLQNLKHK
jgi:hypothetical protein